MVLCFKKKAAMDSFYLNSLSRNITRSNQPNTPYHRSFFSLHIVEFSSQECLPAAVSSQWPLWEATSTVSATPLVQPRRQPSFIVTNASLCYRKGLDRDGRLANPCGGAGSMRCVDKPGMQLSSRPRGPFPKAAFFGLYETKGEC